MRRYVSPDEDSARWRDFALRPGDIVVSTRSKHGTTWVQTILLLLIHQRPDLPAPLPALSPWLDHLAEPEDAVFARLEAQRHRRVIKTHTPLDGLPSDPDVTYVVAVRHPLDAAVSLYHQSHNLDRQRLQELTGAPAARRRLRPPIGAWLEEWIDSEADPAKELDSLPGVLWHLSDAWSRRTRANVLLVHYDDLLQNLDGQMRRLAVSLDIAVADHLWDGLVEAATLRAMRSRADDLAPDTSGILRDRPAFFRRGTSGAAAEILDTAAQDRYHRRAAALAPADLLRWVHGAGTGRPDAWH